MPCLPLPHAVDFNLFCWDTPLVDMLSDPFSNSCCALMALLQIMFSHITLHVCCPLLIQLLAISNALNPQLTIRSDVAMDGKPPDDTPYYGAYC
jgi:hypothetical protein